MRLRIISERQPVAPGALGEDEVHGQNGFDSNWDRPEATAAAFRTDGWFRTGVVGVLEVEDILRRYVGTADVAVVGVPDVTWGERVAAVVAVNPPGGAASARRFHRRLDRAGRHRTGRLQTSAPLRRGDRDPAQYVGEDPT